MVMHELDIYELSYLSETYTHTLRPSPFSPTTANRTCKHSKLEEELYEKIQKLEEIAKERAKELVHADRLATIGTMTASIAHEINNSLTYISGNAMMLKMFWEIVGPLIKERVGDKDIHMNEILERIIKMTPLALTDINKGVERIGSIVRDLKMYSATNSPENQNFEIKQAYDNSIKFCGQLLEKNNCSITCSMNGLQPVLTGNLQHYEQIFTNLFINAMDAMQKSKSKWINVEFYQIESNVLGIDISDTGTGISLAKIDQIFNPFFTTKAVGKGTGLGLSIVKKLVESYHGEISVANKPQGGAVFSIRLPGAKCK